MADPWRVLGLSADAADEKQVRSAYARLLKIHRPDQDPEGFQRLRTAYQHALEWIQQRDAFDLEDWGDEDVEEVPAEAEAPATAETVHAPPALLPSWGEGAAPSLPDQLDVPRVEPVAADEEKAPEPQPREPQLPPPLLPSWGEGAAPSLPDQLDVPPAEPVAADEERAPEPQPREPQLPPPLPPSWGEGAAPSLPDQLSPNPSVPSPQPKRPARKKRPERDWPREWSYSLESLDRALKGELREFDAVSMALKALTLDVMEYGIPPQALECILSDAFQDEARLFGIHAPESMVLYLLKGRCVGFLSDVLRELKQSEVSMNITRLAQKFDECAADVLSPATEAIYFDVACLVAMHNPFIAKSIGRKLRRLLDDNAHEPQFDRLHAATMRGMAFRDLTPEHREFWSKRLEHPKEAYEWRADDLSGQALAAVVLLGKKWVGLPLVQELVPADVWARAWSGRWRRVLVQRFSKKRFQSNSPGVMLAVLASVLFTCAMRLFDGITKTSKSTTMPSAEFQREFESQLSRLQKELEKKKQEKNRQNVK